MLVAARAAREGAYAPYSHFRVGAALLCAGGEIVTGANVENASYGVSMCAERVALFAAVSRGLRTFAALAIAGEGPGITPCGACRQALSEFGQDLVIVREGVPDVTLRELLPETFGPDHLERARI